MTRSPSVVDAKPEHRLLTLLTLAHPDDQEKKQIAETVEEVTDWDLWYETASFNKVIPICYHTLRLTQLLPRLPAIMLDKIESETGVIAKANELRNKEAEIFLSEFGKNNVRVALLKGVAFGEIVYRNPGYKRMNDIDLLIDKVNLETIYRIYADLGYFYFGERISGSKKKSDRMTHLSPPYANKACTCVIGTQWGIKTPLGSFKIDYDSLWKRTLPAKLGGIEVLVLSPEDNLHHLCLHLGFFKISVRDMMDIYNLVRVFRDRIDWTRFYDIVEESRSHNPVYFALALSQYLHHVPEVAAFLVRIEIKASARTKKAISWKTRSMDVFVSQHSDHIQSIEKILAVFDATSWFPEKATLFVKLWKHILWPSKIELIRLGALYKPTRFQIMIARLTTPYNILQVIAQEVGWRLVFLLQVKTLVTLSISLLKFPFVSKHRSDMNAYASKLGLPLPKLIELKDQFQ